MKKLFILAAVAAATMTSCSKENGDNGAVSSEKPITMRAVVDKNVSRASVMTNDRFASFHAMAFRDDYQDGVDNPYVNTAVFSLDGGTTWKYSPKAYYPIDGVKLHFFAYSPIGDRNITSVMYYDGNDAYFDYEVPADQSKADGLAEDLLISSVLNKVDDASNVNFVFNHALSSAVFYAQNQNDKESELVYVITDIRLTSLYNEGRFTYDSGNNGKGSWDNYTTQEDYVAPLPESGVALEPVGSMSGNEKALLTANDILMIMPQGRSEITWGTDVNNPSSSQTYVKVTYNLKDGSGNYIGKDVERYLAITSLSGALYNDGFVQGKCYEFTFKFDASEGIVMTATVSDWINAPTNL